MMNGGNEEDETRVRTTRCADGNGLQLRAECLLLAALLGVVGQISDVLILILAGIRSSKRVRRRAATSVRCPVHVRAYGWGGGRANTVGGEVALGRSAQ